MVAQRSVILGSKLLTPGSNWCKIPLVNKLLPRVKERSEPKHCQNQCVDEQQGSPIGCTSG